MVLGEEKSFLKHHVWRGQSRLILSKEVVLSDMTCYSMHAVLCRGGMVGISDKGC